MTNPALQTLTITETTTNMTLARTSSIDDSPLDDMQRWDEELDATETGDAAAAENFADDENFDRVENPAGAPPARIVSATLSVDRSKIHGAGVFADRAFAPEHLIERCPVLVVPPEQALPIGESTLGDYVYEWLGGYAVALGFGSLYNHSRTSNARYEMDYDADEIHVVAIRAIHAGDEVTVNYNGDPHDVSAVWFEQD